MYGDDINKYPLRILLLKSAKMSIGNIIFHLNCIKLQLNMEEDMLRAFSSTKKIEIEIKITLIQRAKNYPQ